jgi:hypothetical protein
MALRAGVFGGSPGALFPCAGAAIRSLALIGALCAFACPAAEDEAGAVHNGWVKKLGFDADLVGEDGLYGPPDGRRALDYEFCIPDAACIREQVSGIDPSVRFSTSPGRIGCADGDLLAMGNSHQPGFREVIRRLAALPYVRRIEQAWFE